MYRTALRSVLSELVREERLVIVDSLAVEQPRTRELAAQLKGLGLDHVLIVVDRLDENLCLAARNLPNVEVLAASEVNPMSLVRFQKVLATTAAVRAIEERLS